MEEVQNRAARFITGNYSTVKKKPLSKDRMVVDPSYNLGLKDKASIWSDDLKASL